MPDLLTTDLTIISWGRIISFSSTYVFISSTNSLPYRLAFPVPTPAIFCISSRLTGYCKAISSREGSWNITNGGDQVFIVSAQDIGSLEDVLVRAGLVKTAEKKGDELIITCDLSTRTSDLNKTAFENGIVLTKLLPLKRSLESQFLELVK